MGGKFILGIGRDTDDDFVAAITACLKRPLKSPIHPPNFYSGDPEKDAALEAQWQIESLRARIVYKRLPKSLTADERAAVRILRKIGKDSWADEIEHDVLGGLLPPARSDRLKYCCAGIAHDLMSDFTSQQPKDYNRGTCQEIAALFYSAVTGDENVTSSEMEQRLRFSYSRAG